MFINKKYDLSIHTPKITCVPGYPSRESRAYHYNCFDEMGDSGLTGKELFFANSYLQTGKFYSLAEADLWIAERMKIEQSLPLAEDDHGRYVITGPIIILDNKPFIVAYTAWRGVYLKNEGRFFREAKKLNPMTEQAIEVLSSKPVLVI